MRSISAILFCGAVVAVFVRTASAQAGSQVASATTTMAPASVVLLNGKPIGPAEPWSAKPVGSYDLVIPTGGSMIIASLTIAEIAGKLSATMVQLDDPGPVAMDVAVNGTDLVLTLNRPRARSQSTSSTAGDNFPGTGPSARWTVAPLRGRRNSKDPPSSSRSCVVLPSEENQLTRR